MQVDSLLVVLGWAAAAYAVTGAMQLPRLLRYARSLPTPDRLVGLATLLLFFGMFVWWERTGVAAPFDRSAQLQLVCFGTASGLLILTLLTHLPFTERGPYAALFLYLYATAAVISAAASPHLLLSMYDAAAVVLDLLLAVTAIYTMRGYGRELFLPKLVIYSICFLIFLESAGVVYQPEAALRPIYSGGSLGIILSGVLPQMNANELGFLSGTAVIFGLIGVVSPTRFTLKVFNAAQFVMGGILLYLAQARTTLVGLTVILLCSLVFLPRIRIYAGATILGIAMVVLVRYHEDPVLIDSISTYLSRGESEQELVTLSGRTGLWLAGWEMLKDAPFFGHGYEAGVRFLGHHYGLPPGTHMHNTYMQILANTGLVGCAAWIGFMVFLLSGFFGRLVGDFRRRSYGAPDRYFLAGMGMMLVLITIKTMTASMLTGHQPAMLIAIAALVYGAAARDVVADRAGSTLASSGHGASVRTGRQSAALGREVGLLRPRPGISVHGAAREAE